MIDQLRGECNDVMTIKRKGKMMTLEKEKKEEVEAFVEKNNTLVEWDRINSLRE